MDWNTASPPLPYIWADLEAPSFELSEAFLPEDLSHASLQILCDAFCKLNSISVSNPESTGPVNIPYQNAPAQTTLVQLPLLPLTKVYIGDLKREYLEKLSAISDCGSIQSSRVFRDSLDLLSGSTDPPAESLSALLFYIMGARVAPAVKSGPSPYLPLKPDLLLARCLLMAVYGGGSLLAKLVQLYLGEARKAISILTAEAPVVFPGAQPSSSALASHPQGDALMRHWTAVNRAVWNPAFLALHQVLHLVFCSLNILGVSLKPSGSVRFAAVARRASAPGQDQAPGERVLPAYGGYALSHAELVSSLVCQEIRLVQAMLPDPGAEGQSIFKSCVFLCALAARATSFLRHLLIQALGEVGDHRQSVVCRATKAGINALNSTGSRGGTGPYSMRGLKSALSSQTHQVSSMASPGAPPRLPADDPPDTPFPPALNDPAYHCAARAVVEASSSTGVVLKQVRRLPPPRFHGYVNPSSQAALTLERQRESGLGDAALFSDISDPANTINQLYQSDAIVEQSRRAEDVIAVFHSRQRPRLIGQIGVEYDSLSLKKEDMYLYQFQLFPRPRVRGCFYTLGELHGAQVAMRAACDCRSIGSVLSTVGRSQDPASAPPGLYGTVQHVPAAGGAGHGGYKYGGYGSYGSYGSYGGGTEEGEASTPGYSTDSPAYSLHQARLALGLVQGFSYSGRPLRADINKYYSRCVKTLLNMFPDKFGASLPLGQLLSVFEGSQPLDARRAMLRGMANPGDYCAEACPCSLILREVDVSRAVSCLLRLAVASIPPNADTVLNKAMGDVARGGYSNSSALSIRHIREQALKGAFHCLLLFLVGFRRRHPAFGEVIARAIQVSQLAAFPPTLSTRQPSSQVSGEPQSATVSERGSQAGEPHSFPVGLEPVFAVLSLPVTTYICAADRRTVANGTCLFDDERVPGPEELAADASEFTQTKSIKGLSESGSGPSSVPMASYASSRRLFCVVTAGRILYGYCSHSQLRANDLVAQFSRVSANYISAVLQTTAARPQEASRAGSGYNGRSVLSKARMSDPPGWGDPGAQRYSEGDLVSITTFLQGNNLLNNPGNIDTTHTHTCIFPGFQLTKLNNMSTLIVFLKLAKVILPFVVGDTPRNASYSVEPPGFTAFCEYVYRTIYQLAITPQTEDRWRWTRSVVAENAGLYDELGRRAVVDFMTAYVMPRAPPCESRDPKGPNSEAETATLKFLALNHFLWEPRIKVDPECLVEEELALSQLQCGWRYRE